MLVLLDPTGMPELRPLTKEGVFPDGLLFGLPPRPVGLRDSKLRVEAVSPCVCDLGQDP